MVPARVNVPHFVGSVSLPQSAVAWFGKVTASENYADLRFGYNDSELVLTVHAFDRRLWYNPSPATGDLTAWDAATLYLKPSPPTAPAYRFVAQLNWWEARAAYQAAYRNSGSGWTSAALPFASTVGWRGDVPNSDIDDRGWTVTFRIPFTSLGLSGVPAEGEVWQAGVTLHDRDSSAGPANPAQNWPPAMQLERAETWAQLGFGLPAYPAPVATPAGTVTIRQGLQGAVVPDVAVGGGANCGEGTDFWTAWGNANFAAATDFNVQNQADVADWPCFSKYYVTFPLDAVPAGKKILSAALTLHQFGNSEPSQARASLMQVLTIREAWNEAGLTWNNAPQAYENVSRAWVDPLPAFPGWPGAERRFDLSGAVASAYALGEPALRLALYSADSAYHSGKYFVSSDAGDWNAVGRPTLIIQWGEP